MSSERWTRGELTTEDFQGWVPWSECPGALKIDRTAGGVYVVLREDPGEPVFLDASPAGTFRGDPSVSREELLDNWVPGVAVLYIGKGDHGVLRTRLSAYVRFGRGRNARHSGGRLIWQVEGAQDFLVAWRILEPEEVPLDVETAHDRRLHRGLRQATLREPASHARPVALNASSGPCLACREPAQ